MSILNSFKKKTYSSFSYLFIIFLIIIFYSCNSKESKNSDKIASVNLIEKEFNFGKVSFGDTVYHKFKLQNISKIPFKINQIGTSCGCTTSNYTKDSVNFNQFAMIEVMYIPQKQGLGAIRESIVIDCNVEPGFITFYLTGEIN